MKFCSLIWSDAMLRVASERRGNLCTTNVCLVPAFFELLSDFGGLWQTRDASRIGTNIA